MKGSTNTFFNSGERRETDISYNIGLSVLYRDELGSMYSAVGVVVVSPLGLDLCMVFYPWFMSGFESKDNIGFIWDWMSILCVLQYYGCWFNVNT